MTHVVEAGGIGPLPADAAAPTDADVLTVRVYRHSGLGDDADRPVVRLVPATLGQAEDLTMSFLGFGEPERADAVGVVARQALGFPAWALVHDPANGRHALAMVKRMRKVAKQAASKPAFAMDEYRAMAEILGGAAPQFLPTFWEEAGRAFLAGENVRFAATGFNLAREAEQVYALEVDEDRVADVFLEYALAGALPVKAISQYARDLAARGKPDEAFERFRTVTLRRVASGLPPYAALPAEVKRLATAAGIGGDAALDDLVADLLGLAATARSAAGTWKALRPAIVRVAKKRPEVRGRLLAMLPDPPGYGNDMTDEWIDLLAATGADAALVGPAEPGAESPDGPAGWLERLARQRNRGWRTARSQPLLALVERMLPALRAAGRPVVLADADDADLDLVDLCLAGDVNVGWTGKPAPTVWRWVQDTRPGRRSLEALAEDERFTGPLGESAVAVARGGDDRLATVLDARGLRALLTRWMGTLPAAAPADPTVLGLARYAGELDWVTTADAAGLNPDAVRRIAAADVAAALTRTLRTGLLAEFTWPTLDAVRDEVPADADLGGSWPNLVLATRKKAVVIGPDEVVLTHRYGKDVQQWWADAAWIPGVNRLLVYHYRQAYWADAPGEVFRCEREALQTARALPLPDGSATFGGTPWKPGDTTFPRPHRLIGDGERYWVLRDLADGYRWQCYDPATGTVREGDLPAFLAAETEPDLRHRYCDLVPAPARFAGSPLGYADGMIGWRVVARPDGSEVGTGIDGRRVEFPAPIVGNAWATGGLLFPGTDRPCPVTATGHGLRQGTVTVYTPDGDQPLVAVEPDRDVPPTGWWHAWLVRDAAGSAALRALDPALARDLLAPIVAAVDIPKLALKGDGSKTEEAARKAVTAAAKAAVTEALPAVRDTRLREAVVDTVVAAAWLAVRLRVLDALAGGLVADEAAERAGAASTVGIDSGELRSVLADLDQRTWIDDNDVARAFAQLAALPRVFAGNGTDGATGNGTGGGIGKAWKATDLTWPALLGILAQLVVRAVTPATPQPQREAVVALLGALAGSGVAEADGTVRVAYLAAAKKAFGVPQVIRSGERTILVVNRAGYSSFKYAMIDHDPSGAFGPIEGGSLVREIRPGWGGRAAIEAVLARLAADGPVPWRAEAVDELVAATGMSRGTAGMVLAGMPNVSSGDANFLPKQTRELLGLSAAEARAGRDTLCSLAAEHRRELLAALMPADPARWWTDGPDVARVAAVWMRLFGTRLTVPDEVFVDAKKAPIWGLADAVLALAAEPVWLEPGHRKEFAGQVPALARTLRWLAYRLPVDSPLRASLPGWYEAARAQLADPKLKINAGYLEKGTPLPPSVTMKGDGDGWRSCTLFPAQLSGPDDPALHMFGDDRDVVGVRTLLAPGLGELMAAVGAEDARPGWAQNPATEVPDLVAEVAAHHDLDADAAVYYLQLLALGDPTDRNVLRWTGWTAARLRKARAAVLAAGLVVEAKRERAGRSVFLPGGWLKSPPLEEWKLTLLGFAGDDAEDRLPDAPTRTPAALFRAAWTRVRDGDGPRLRELGRTR